MCRRGINQLALKHPLGSTCNSLLSRALKRMMHLNKHELFIVSEMSQSHNQNGVPFVVFSLATADEGQHVWRLIPH